MADAALFIGFGPAVSGRERRALALFNEALAYNTRLQAEGEIENFEAALLEPHGGELGGFVLLRGDADKLHRVRTSEEFQRLNTRAALVVERLGVVDAVVGDGIGQQVSVYQEAVRELA